MNQAALLLDELVTPGEPQSVPAPTNAVGRTLDVLGAFDGSRTILGVSEVAARAGVPKSTAHRLLNIMAQRGFVRRTGNRYRLAERVFELGSRALEPRGLRERAIPFMAELQHASLETVHLAVLHGTQVLYVEKIFGHGTVPIPTVVGGRNPASCTALGKAILSRSLDETVDKVISTRLPRLTHRSLHTPDALIRNLYVARDDEVAVDYEECRAGLACVAAPIIKPSTGEAVAALSISAPTSRFNKRLFAAQLLKATGALSRTVV